MANFANDTDAFHAAIARLLAQSRNDESATLEVPAVDARLVREGLERLVLDAAELGEYLRFLDALNRPRFFRSRDLTDLPPAVLAQAVESGLGGLSNEQLAVLALSPFQLRDVQEALDEHGLSDYWWSVAIRTTPTSLPEGDALVTRRTGERGAASAATQFVALDGQQPGSPAATEERRTRTWTEQVPLATATFSQVQSEIRLDVARRATLVATFEYRPDVDGGTLDVRLSEPLPMRLAASCSATMLDELGKPLTTPAPPHFVVVLLKGQVERLRCTHLKAALERVRAVRVEYVARERYTVSVDVPFLLPS